MLEAIIKRLKRDKRGVSNVIVVMLSLILIVVIVANVVLWSYQMNQIDWERMQENIAILDVTTIRETWLYNPSGYALGGSTSWLSGGISNLISDNSVYMTFKSYYSDITDFVDNNISDVDSSVDKGMHSNFTAQQTGPDLINDTLTEQNTGGGITWFLNSDSKVCTPTVGSWQDVDMSADTDIPDGVTGLVLEIVNENSNNAYSGQVRAKGSADDRTSGAKIKRKNSDYGFCQVRR